MAEEQPPQAPPVAGEEQPKVEDKGEKGERREGGRGFGKGGQKPRGPRQPRDDWRPVTKLGRLVKHGQITSFDEIFRFSIPIKECEIVNFFWNKMKEEAEKNNDHTLKLREDVMQIKPVQKQTKAGQRTRFKAYMCIGDGNGHVGLGWKAGKDVQSAIKGALAHAKLNLVPVRKGYWGNKIGNSHTIPIKVTGKSGSVRIRLIPAPRGTGLCAAGASKKVLQFAGIGDIFTSSKGCTRTKGNFVKATYYALTKTYKYLTPDFWGTAGIVQHPFETHSAMLAIPEPKAQVKKRF